MCAEQVTLEYTFLKWFNVSTLFSHISVIRVTPVMRTPWFFSVIRLRVAGRNISISSGTRLMIRKAQSAAFFRMYAFGDFINLSTSDAKSLAISGDAIAPRVHNARPMTNCVELFKSLREQKQEEDVDSPEQEDSFSKIQNIDVRDRVTVTFLDNLWSGDVRLAARPATAWLPSSRFVYQWIWAKRWASNIPIDQSALDTWNIINVSSW